MTPLPLLLAATLAGDPLAELQAALAGLEARAPVRARLDYRFERVNGKGEEAVVDAGGVRAEASEGPGGVTLRWSPELVEEAREEARRGLPRPTSPGATLRGRHAGQPAVRMPVRRGSRRCGR